MSRKNRKYPRIRPAAAGPALEPGDTVIGKRGFALLAAALALVCAGYFFLKRTDPAGENFYAVLSPLFLLAGYLLAPAALFPLHRSAKPGDK